MSFRASFMALGACVALTACVQQGYGQQGYGQQPYGQQYGGGGQQGTIFTKENIGTVGGAAVGAVLGSKFGKGTGQGVGIALGTLAGAVVGNSIGSSLDRADMNYYGSANQQAMQAPVGQTVQWNNPQTGNYGSFTPNNYYQSPNGQMCREFTQTITVGGQVQQGVGRACQNPDGSWQMQ